MSLKKLAPLLPIALGFSFVSPVYASGNSGSILELLNPDELNGTLTLNDIPSGQTFTLTGFNSTGFPDDDWQDFTVTLGVSGSNVTVNFASPGNTLNNGSYAATYNLDLPTGYTFTGTTLTVTNPSPPVNFSASTSSGSTGNTITGVISTLTVSTTTNDFGLNEGFTSNYQAVPWETDVLPLVGATALFAGAVWWKRRRGAEALDLSEATPDSEQMTDIR
jgi:hypothetical protein